MKKLLALSLLLTLPLLYAMGGKPQVEPFAVVNTEKVFSESSLAQEGFKRIQDAQLKAEAKLAEMEKAIDASDASEEAKMLRKQLELQGVVATLQAILDENQKEVVTIIENSLQEAFKKVREEKNISMIFPSDTVLSYDETADITAEVLEAINSLNITLPEIPSMEVEVQEADISLENLEQIN